MTRRIIALSLTLSLTLAMLACDGDDETGTSTGTTTGTTTTDTTTDTGTGGGGGGGGGSAGLEIEMYTSDPMGPAVNSVLITGAEDAVLVDGQFWLADAEAVIQMVQDSQKTLRTIFLTHPHPDHYLGLKPIQEAFPQAQIVATQAVVDDYNGSAQATFDFLKAQQGDNIADGIAEVQVLQGASIDLEGHALQVVEMEEPGESAHAAVLVIEDGNALVAGDLLYNNVHLVLAECQGQGWVNNLNDTIKPIGMEKIFPGHGPATTPDVIDADIAYIEQATLIMDAAATPEEATMQIKAAFTAYASDFLLGFSVGQYFMNCKQ